LGASRVTEGEPLDGDAEVAREPGHVSERRGPSPEPSVEVLGRVAALLAEAPDIWTVVLPVAKLTKAQPNPSRHPLNLTHGFSSCATDMTRLARILREKAGKRNGETLGGLPPEGSGRRG